MSFTGIAHFRHSKFLSKYTVISRKKIANKTFDFIYFFLEKKKKKNDLPYKSFPKDFFFFGKGFTCIKPLSSSGIFMLKM